MKLLKFDSEESFHSQYMTEYNKLYASTPLTADALQALISNKVIELNASLYDKCENFIKDFYQLSRKIPSKLNDHEKHIVSARSPNRSVLMAYDFHIDTEDNPKLIEVNTNAAGYLPVHLLYKSMNDNSFDPDLNKLKESFYRELVTFYGYSREPEYTAIIDEDIDQQKMFFEFKMYSHLFDQWGWDNNIHSFDELKYSEQFNTLTVNDKKVDLIYNRYCDFLLSRIESADLLNAFTNKSAVFSPNPKEYLLAADKSRLVEFSHAYENSVILKSYYVNEINPEELWKRRKTLFFKPLRSHGGKESYRGSSITKKVFERVINDHNFTAQEFIPAPIVTDHHDVKWKFDLRFFVYKDEIQQVVARLYQGQVTNFKTAGGGFTAVKFI